MSKKKKPHFYKLVQFNDYNVGERSKRRMNGLICMDNGGHAEPSACAGG